MHGRGKDSHVGAAVFSNGADQVGAFESAEGIDKGQARDSRHTVYVGQGKYHDACKQDRAAFVVSGFLYATVFGSGANQWFIMVKNYLIIGGSHGIGFALAQKLAIEGQHVICCSRTLGELASLPSVTHYAYDVLSDNLQAEWLPESLHGLVYCPGSIQLKPFHRISADDFRQELEINTVGAFRVIQQALGALKKSGEASVVLFSTVAAQTGMPFHSSIAAAKGAVEGLTRALAAELAPTVRVNAIAPSLTDTPLAAGLLSSDEKRQNAATRHPLRRIGTPDDMAEAAFFLLQESSGFMTGQILHIDGGLSALR